uniref:Peptidase n=1 Tax=viral metagenome TaxID=1070528 RepID=A0A6M3XV55_9ZZZZ
MDRNIILKPGDIFCTRNPMLLGRAICFFEKLHAKDNQAEYSHAGIILSGNGETFEALWTNRRQNLWEAYKGQKVLIGSHKNMTAEAFVKGWDGIKKYEGQWYAGWRLFLHMMPFLSKIGTGGFAVCSELAGKFIEKSGIYEEFYWKGRNPDDIADMIHNWKGWTMIYEGEI